MAWEVTDLLWVNTYGVSELVEVSYIVIITTLQILFIQLLEMSYYCGLHSGQSCYVHRVFSACVIDFDRAAKTKMAHFHFPKKGGGGGKECQDVEKDWICGCIESLGLAWTNPLNTSSRMKWKHTPWIILFKTERALNVFAQSDSNGMWRRNQGS